MGSGHGLGAGDEGPGRSLAGAQWGDSLVSRRRHRGTVGAESAPVAAAL